MHSSELLARATAFDAGPSPTLNGVIYEESDNVSFRYRMSIKKITAGWVITDAPNQWLNKNTKEMEYIPSPSSIEDELEFYRQFTFTKPEDAFEFLAVWKAEEREKAKKEGFVTYQEMARKHWS